MMTFIENDILNINCLRQYDIKIRIFLLPMYVFTAWRGGGNLFAHILEALIAIPLKVQIQKVGTTM